MSTAIMAKCWPLQMPPTPKAVLISLADNANDAGDCWPALSTICERTCFGRTAVINAIEWLEKHGAVVADRTNGRHSRYRVTPEGFVMKPVHEADGSVSRTGTAGEPVPVHLADDRYTSRTGPVREADTNRKEPSLKATVKEPRASAAADLFAGVAPQVVADFKALRKAKRAPITKTAIDGIAAQAARAGLTLESALKICIDRNWQGFNADWLKTSPLASSQPTTRPGGGRREL